MCKNIVVFVLLLTGLSVTSALADRYLCTYTARISEWDKLNSQGQSLVSGYNLSSVAAVIRQDRANFHKFNRQDLEDTDDCAFASPQARQRLENFLRNGSVSQEALRRIADGTPLIDVDVYDNHVDVRLLNEQSSIR
ncbi:MAG: hypothetical protein IK129_06430 [Deltaproteobacteria bacterium]|nr:hypothetical protein [Deltaproteobacteria bacterium]